MAKKVVMLSMLLVDSLHVYYGMSHALRGVSLTVADGEIVAIIGPNGAGKSTLLKAISGLVRIKGGSIVLDGKRIDGKKPHEIVAMGVAHVPEGRRVFANLTVRQNLLIGAFLQKRKHEIRELQDYVFSVFPRLKERQHQRAGTLSGGEQQMLAIARGLMQRPRILMMDEPSLGLAPILIEEIFENVRYINGLGTTIVMVEQNAKKALEIANRCYVVETGTVVVEGRADVLREDPRVAEAYLGQTISA